MSETNRNPAEHYKIHQNSIYAIPNLISLFQKRMFNQSIVRNKITVVTWVIKT